MSLGFPNTFFIPRLLRMSSSPAWLNISPASLITLGSEVSASREYPPSSLRFEFHSLAMCIVSAVNPRSFTP